MFWTEIALLLGPEGAELSFRLRSCYFTRAEGIEVMFRLHYFFFNFSGRGLNVLGICEMILTNKDGEFAALNS